MPSQSSGPLTTFLMFVPLVAVPALAIFGIPEFAPLTALGRAASTTPEKVSAAGNHNLLQQSTDDLLSPVRNTIHGGGANKALDTIATASDVRSDDPFRQVSAAPAAKEQDAEPSESWAPPDNVLRDWDLHPAGGSDAASAKSPARGRELDRSALTAVDLPKEAAESLDTDASPFRPVDEDDQSKSGEAPAEESKAAPMKSKPAFDPDELGERNRTAPSPRAAAADAPRDERKDSADKLTWRTAVQRLNKLGIRNFELQPSDKPEVFHFSCSYTESDRPRISHRFEAEAEEPLEAVHKVLAQIETMAKRP